MEATQAQSLDITSATNEHEQSPLNTTHLLLRLRALSLQCSILVLQICLCCLSDPLLCPVCIKLCLHVLHLSSQTLNLFDVLVHILLWK